MIAAAWTDFTQNIWLYLSLPVIAAIIGYVTKVLAIRMMFQPLEFMGWKPYLGWQGIVPKKAEKMAGIAVDTMTSKLISPEEIFARLDPDRVAREIEAPLLAAVQDITRDVMAQYQPGLWETLPQFLRDKLIRRVQAESPEVVAQVMTEIRDNIGNLFDLKHMVITNLVRNKALLNRIFKEVGHEEFRFFGNSGLYFGFLIGLIQMVTWAFYKEPWILPAFGLFVGFSSDWLALKLMFHPKKPRKILGYTVQGLFLKRQQQVAHDYADLIARELLTPNNFWEALLNGPTADRIVALVQKHVQQMVDEQSGIARPVVALAIGTRRYQDMKKSVADRMLEKLPETLRHVDRYAEDAMDIRNTLITRMQKLSAEEFENLLRPAFKEDEWILITVGGALGFLVGELQVQLMLHFGGLV